MSVFIIRSEIVAPGQIQTNIRLEFDGSRKTCFDFKNAPFGYFYFMRYILLLLLLLAFGCTKKEYDVIIRGATVIDGSGAEGQTMDVVIQGDTIAFVGDLSDAIGKEEIQGEDLVLAPGFIDTHSHHDRGLIENPDALAAISQGITTIVVGQDGNSAWPLKDYFQSLQDKPTSVNVASYSGHNTLRDVVMGSNFKREAIQTEIDSMKAMLHADMEAGAIGLSTGLEYDSGIAIGKSVAGTQRAIHQSPTQ
jgi:N-acyl-D-amino-acid deacylase